MIDTDISVHTRGQSHREKSDHRKENKCDIKRGHREILKILSEKQNKIKLGFKDGNIYVL